MTEVAAEAKPPLSPAAQLRLERIEGLLEEARVNSIVEVGAGNGALSWHISAGRDYLGFEPDEQAFEQATQRLAARPRATLVNAEIPPAATEQYDALVALEVLEHVDDDAKALVQWSRWVRPAGLVVLSVPAKQKRYGPYDRAVGHYRRYERDQLLEVMAQAGLEDLRIYSYGMPLGYVLEFYRNRVLAQRLQEASVDEATARSGRSFQPQHGGPLISLLVSPFRVLQRPFERTTFGIGWVASGQVGK